VLHYESGTFLGQLSRRQIPKPFAVRRIYPRGFGTKTFLFAAKSHIFRDIGSGGSRAEARGYTPQHFLDNLRFSDLLQVYVVLFLSGQI
jgi:hypothetical protein